MMAALDTGTAQRLAKLCGMLGSDHHGERANAAALATRALHDVGLDWRALVEAAVRGAVHLPRAPISKVPPHRAIALWCLERVGRLPDRDAEFIRTIMQQQIITPKQASWLDDIAARLGHGKRT